MHSRSENSYERAMNIARTWNPKNRSRLRGRENLPGTERMQKDAATLWWWRNSKAGNVRKKKKKGRRGRERK